MTDAITLAGRGRRFIATAIDCVLVPIVALALMLVTGVLEHAEDFIGAKPLWRGLLLGLSSYLLLNGWLLWQRGQTIGKAVMGIAIVGNADGARLPLWKLLLARGPFFLATYAIVLGPLALLPVLDCAFIFRKDRRCLHDLVSGSRVVPRGGDLGRE